MDIKDINNANIWVNNYNNSYNNLKGSALQRRQKSQLMSKLSEVFASEWLLQNKNVKTNVDFSQNTGKHTVDLVGDNSINYHIKSCWADAPFAYNSFMIDANGEFESMQKHGGLMVLVYWNINIHDYKTYVDLYNDLLINTPTFEMLSIIPVNKLNLKNFQDPTDTALHGLRLVLPSCRKLVQDYKI